MNLLFGKKCENCGTTNPGDYTFCAKCGNPLSGGGGKKCGFCGTDNKQDSDFCKKCGRPLNAFEAVKVHGNKWSRRPGDFASRLEVSDLPGLLTKQLEVEVGTQALIQSPGMPQELLPPGFYTLDSIGKTISSWLNGVPKTTTVLLVDVSPAEMIIPVANRFTSDPLPISLSMRLVVEVENASKFLITALHGRDRYSLEDLRNYVEPEVAAVTDAYLRKRTLDQLVESGDTRKDLELAVEEALRTTFRQYGLKLVSLRTVELDLEAYDKVKGIKGKYSLIAVEGGAELTGREVVADLKKRNMLQDMVEETAKVEIEERKVELYQRMRKTVLTDRINEVKSEEEFNKFLAEIDYQKLLSEKERQDLLKRWKEEGEDNDRARASLLARAEVEEKYSLRAIEVKSNGELEAREQDFRLELERKRAEMTLHIEEQKWQGVLKRRAAELEVDRTEAQMGIDLLDQMETRKIDRRLREARGLVEIELQKEEAAHRREMEHLDKLGALGTDALIAASPTEQGKIIADLKRTEIFKDMSEDQILAMAAEKSPEVARAFGEKFRAIAEGQASAREKEMYEKLIVEQKAAQVILIENQREAMERLQRMSEHHVDAMRDISIAYATKGSDPVIIAGAGGGQVIGGAHHTHGSQQEETKVCPGCGRLVEVSSRFCPYCSVPFKDVN